MTSDPATAPVVVTDGSGTGFRLTAGGTQSIESNSELSAADFSNNLVQARVVGCGMRLRYTGRQIDMNGTVFALEEPSHLGTGGFTVEDLLRYDRVKTVPFTREWTVVTWQPVLPTETAYSTNCYASGYPNVYNSLILVIQCQDGGTEKLPFEWEWYLHYEAVGVAARGKTPSHLAPIAGMNVMAALQSAPSTMYDDISNRKVNIHKLSDRMVEKGSSFNQVTQLASRVLHTAVGAITSRAAQQYMAGGLAAIAL